MSFWDTISDIVSAPFEAAGNVTGIKVNPFRPQDARITAPNPNLNDIGTLATLFAPGGNLAKASFGSLGLGNLGTASLLGAAGLKDPRKMNLGDALALLQRAQGGGSVARGGVSGGVGGGFQGMQQNAFLDAARALAPENRDKMIAGYQGQANRMAKRTGRVRRGRLRAQGYGKSAQSGAEIDAMNQANEATSQYAQQVNSPESIANSAMARAKLLSPENIYGYDRYNAQMQLLGNQIAGSRPESTFEQIFGIGSQIVPYLMSQKQNQPQQPQKRTGSTNKPFHAMLEQAGF